MLIDIGGKRKKINMCRIKAEGGRRCGHGTEYDRILRNLQAKKQYHQRQGHTEQVETLNNKIRNYRTAENGLITLNETIKLYPMTLSLTPNTQKLINHLNEANLQAYIVGGAVRDALAGAAIKDVDIEVYGAEQESLLTHLKKLTRNVDTVGQEFGVIKVNIGDEEFDVSLPRKETKTGEAHTDFDVTVDKDLSIEEASSRRDFTVNALMYDPNLELVLDAHDGMKHWKDKELHHISDAFDESPLRVLRGVQFAARFNMTMNPDTAARSATLADTFTTISENRVQIEFEKLFTKATHPERAIEVLKQTGWDKNFAGLHEADHSKISAALTKAGQIARSNEMPERERVVLFASALASNLPEGNREEFLKYITLGQRRKNEALALTDIDRPDNLNDQTLRNWVKGMSSGATTTRWVNLQKATSSETARYLKKLTDRCSELNIAEEPERDIINGNDLMEALGNPRAGRWLGQSLNKVRQAQYSNEFRTKEAALDWIQRNKDELTG